MINMNAYNNMFMFIETIFDDFRNYWLYQYDQHHGNAIGQSLKK